MSDRPTLGTAQEATEGRWSPPETGIEAQDVQAPERAADGRTADPDQLAALRAWLADAAHTSRHGARHARGEEVRWVLDGFAHAYELAVVAVDRLTVGRRLPMVGGVRPSECTEDHQAVEVEPAGELAVLRAQVAAARQFAKEMRGYCSWQGVSAMYADRLDAALDNSEESGRG